MSTTGLWIVTGIEGVLILGLGVFGWMASQGLTRIVVKTGEELGKKVTDISKEIPILVENAIEKGGDAMTANVADKVKDESAGIELMPKVPEVPAGGVPETAAGSVPENVKKGGGKQTKGNKPKKIRKPRTKKNIKKVGNQMYMNFSL
jgi:hypothetical protein